MHGYGEIVRGQIIGGDWANGRLFYDGRPQSQALRGDDDADLMRQAREIKVGLRGDLGDEFRRLFPDDSKWELRIYP